MHTLTPHFSLDELLGTYMVLEASLSSFPTRSHRTLSHGSALPHALSCRICISLRTRIRRGGSMQCYPHQMGHSTPQKTFPGCYHIKGWKTLLGILHRELGGDLSPSVCRRMAVEGQLQPRSSARSSGDAACTSKQGGQGLATAGHSAQGGVGTPMSLRQHCSTPRAVEWQWQNSCRSLDQKCRELSSENPACLWLLGTLQPACFWGMGLPLPETSFTCLLPIKPKIMGMKSSLQESRKQAPHSVQLDPWHMLVDGECSLNANAEGTCPRLQYKLKSKAPFLPPCPPTHPSPIPLVQTPLKLYRSQTFIP